MELFCRRYVDKSKSLIMEIYNGIDLLSIDRIGKIYKKYGKKFLKKIFSISEINEFGNLKISIEKKIEKIASSFSAKESLSKAIGTGISDNVRLKDIQIFRDNLGKPEILLKNNTLKFLMLKKKSYKNFRISLSITNEKNCVITSVVILFF